MVKKENKKEITVNDLQIEVNNQKEEIKQLKTMQLKLQKEFFELKEIQRKQIVESSKV